MSSWKPRASHAPIPLSDHTRRVEALTRSGRNVKAVSFNCEINCVHELAWCRLALPYGFNHLIDSSSQVDLTLLALGECAQRM